MEDVGAEALDHWVRDQALEQVAHGLAWHVSAACSRDGARVDEARDLKHALSWTTSVAELLAALLAHLSLEACELALGCFEDGLADAEALRDLVLGLGLRRGGSARAHGCHALQVLLGRLGAGDFRVEVRDGLVELVDALGVLFCQSTPFRSGALGEALELLHLVGALGLEVVAVLHDVGDEIGF